jgi:hypothetical protein
MSHAGVTEHPGHKAQPVSDLGNIVRGWIPEPVRYVWAGIKDMASERLLGAMLVAGFLVVKVIVVARGNLTTALAILHTTGVATVVVGGLLSALPILLTMLLAGATAWALYLFGRWVCHRKKDRRRRSVQVPGSGDGGEARRGGPVGLVSFLWLVMAGAASFYLTPLPVLFVGFGSGLAILLFWLCQRASSARGFSAQRVTTASQGTDNQKSRKALRWIMAGKLLLSLVLVGLAGWLTSWSMYAVWLPHERIQFSGTTSPPLVGYVLENDGTWTSILVSRARVVRRYKTSQIDQRTLCNGTTFNFGDHPETGWSELHLPAYSTAADC